MLAAVEGAAASPGGGGGALPPHLPNAERPLLSRNMEGFLQSMPRGTGGLGPSSPHPLLVEGAPPGQEKERPRAGGASFYRELANSSEGGLDTRGMQWAPGLTSRVATSCRGSHWGTLLARSKEVGRGMRQPQNPDKRQRRVPGPRLTLATLINMQKRTFSPVIAGALLPHYSLI